MAELKKRTKLFNDADDPKKNGEHIGQNKILRGFHAKQRKHVKQAMPERKVK